MSKSVFCQKLNKEAPALNEPPFPGALGDRIFAHISQEAWDRWIGLQTILINEYRLSTLNAEHRAYLHDAMDKFLFENQDYPPSPPV